MRGPPDWRQKRVRWLAEARARLSRGVPPPAPSAPVRNRRRVAVPHVRDEADSIDASLARGGMARPPGIPLSEWLDLLSKDT